jgi:hypothetical protein
VRAIGRQGSGPPSLGALELPAPRLGGFFYDAKTPTPIPRASASHPSLESVPRDH